MSTRKVRHRDKIKTGLVRPGWNRGISKSGIRERMEYNAGFHSAHQGKMLLVPTQTPSGYYVLGYMAGLAEVEAFVPHGTSAAAWARSQKRLKEAA